MYEFDDTDLLASRTCKHCGTAEVEANMGGCFVCDFQDACSECQTKHREKVHTAADIEAFRRQMFEAPPLTARERINLELKDQIRRQAETLCRLIDDQEGMVKKYENQCRVLAEELDRRTPAS